MKSVSVTCRHGLRARRIFVGDSAGDVIDSIIDDVAIGVGEFRSLRARCTDLLKSLVKVPDQFGFWRGEIRVMLGDLNQPGCVKMGSCLSVPYQVIKRLAYIINGRRRRHSDLPAVLVELIP